MTTAPDVHWESWRRLRDPAAFEALVRPEMGRALSFARSLGCSEADAEDVLQESLVRLAAERSDGPSRIGVRAWLYRTVRDRARSRRRSWWRRRNREARVARPEATPPRTGDLEAREQVARALDALPDAEREAVRLRYLQDLDYAEMAHVLGVSENACRTRVHRALETLKKRFGAGVATMVAALPLPVPAHSEHLLREVLRSAVPEAGKAAAGAAGKIAAAAVVLASAGAAAFLLPAAENPAVHPRTPPAPLPGGAARTVPTSTANARVRPGSGEGTLEAAAAEPAASVAGRSDPPTGGPAPGSESATAHGPTVADAVALLAEAAARGWQAGLREAPAEVYGTILRIDPAHKVAAERVGTDERDRPDRGDAPKPGPKSEPFDEERARVSAAAAGILSGIGASMAAAGDEKGAQDLWAKALLVDDQDRLANERLGHRMLDGRWTSPRGEAHDRFERRRRELVDATRSFEPGARFSTRSTGIAADAGIAAIAVEGDSFLVETDLPASEASSLVAALSRTRRLCQGLLEVPVPGNRKVDAGRGGYLVLSTEDGYGLVVEACARLRPEEKVDAKRWRSWTVPTTPAVAVSWTNVRSESAENLAHAAAHDDLEGVFGRLDPWLEEGLACAVSCPLFGRALVSDCDAGLRNGRSCSPAGIPTGRFPSLVRSLVLRKRDLPLEELVLLRGASLNQASLAKSLSIVLFLLETDRNEARRFFEDAEEGGSSAKRKSAAERALGKHFPAMRTWKELDAAWRAWALEVYRK